MKTVYDLKPGIYFVCQAINYEPFILVVNPMKDSDDCYYERKFQLFNLNGSQNGFADVEDAKEKKLSDYQTLIKIDYQGLPDNARMDRIVPHLIEVRTNGKKSKS